MGTARIARGAHTLSAENRNDEGVNPGIAHTDRVKQPNDEHPRTTRPRLSVNGVKRAYQLRLARSYWVPRTFVGFDEYRVSTRNH